MNKLKPLTIRTLFSIFLAFTSTQLMAENAQLDCLVKPGMYIELSSPIETTLIDMFVDSGDDIKKGQALALLENTVEIAKVELAKLQALSWSEVENSKVQLQYAKRNLKRIANLYKKNSVSLFEKDKASTEVSLAEIELIKAREKKSLAGLGLKRAKAELDLRTIKSPIDGIVVDIYTKVGESVTGRTIMKLAQIDPLRVEVIAPTEYFGLLKKGMKVDIHPERPANKTFKATITVVDQLIDPASGSFTVRMSLPNSDEQLVGGVNCIASFDFNKPAPTRQGIYGSLSR